MCVSSTQRLPGFADTGMNQTHEQEKISQHQQQHGHEKEAEKQI